MQFEPALARAGIGISYSPLLGNDHLRRLVDGRGTSPLGVARSYVHRVADIVAARSCDLLWVHCEYFPYLPAFVEKLAVSLAGQPFVFDYDDAIFHMYDSARNPVVRRFLSGKLEPLLRRAEACICGNEYLRIYAGRFSGNALVVPTVVDTDIYVPPVRREAGSVTIGWIGSPSTWSYLRPLLPMLQQLSEKRGVRLLVVGAGTAAKSDGFPGLEFADWSEATEVHLVQSMDIGIMPLPDEPWARGKSGYKLIQYMACELPVVASPVGVNSSIVSGDVGMLAADLSAWRDQLEILIDDAELRRSMGARARQRAVAEYSLAVHAPRVVDVLRSAATAKRR